MFRELRRIWEEQSFTNKLVEEFSSMLDASEEMLVYALKVIVNKRTGKKSGKKIYIKDQKINIVEQDIRKRILVHLATNPKGNLPACLALIGLAKDAERLGDYIKNIFELNDMIQDVNENDELFKKLFEDIGNEVLDLLSMVNRAFNESDTEIAMQAAAKARSISQRCEEFIELLLDADYPSREAVALSLGARYFKRVSLHLSNIASSMFMPLTEMDYINGMLPTDET